MFTVAFIALPGNKSVPIALSLCICDTANVSEGIIFYRVWSYWGDIYWSNSANTLWSELVVKVEEYYSMSVV